ncbi:MAG: nitrilase [Betaproteobacteria bacterium]|nr:nitrilase [Betaproteobacteria bacterium]
MEPYIALALQTRCHAVNACDDEGARQRMRDSIDRVHRQVIGAKTFIGPDLKLVVLPEYFLTGYPLGESISGWAEKAALAVEGQEYQRLGALCRDAGVYLSGNAYEADAHFPGLYFQTSFILDNRGDCILRYRRLVSMFTPTPHDVWDRYLEVYGLDGVFPVADTPLGRLACVASEEILYPEIARSLALRGAEVLLHSSSEVHSPRLTPKDVAKRARAIENACWVVSANSAGIEGVDIPGASVDGLSKLVDPQGEVRAEAGSGESMVANAVIDVASLRRQRLKPGMGNLLSRQRLELFAATYSGSVYPPATMLDAQGQPIVPDRGHFMAQQRRSIELLLARGVLRHG